MNDRTLYGFQAKEIQRYILRSGKLSEMVGGSELVYRLCHDDLDSALRLFNFSAPPEALGRAAGGATVLFGCSADAREFARWWPLLCDRLAPGLNVIQAVAEANGDIGRTRAVLEGKLRAVRNHPGATLPEHGPLVAVAPRTGLAAVTRVKGTPLDRESVRKRAVAEDSDALLRRLGGDPAKEEWPRDMQLLAGEEDSYVAVVHADGNRLGLVAQALQKSFADRPQGASGTMKRFSEAVSEATVSAVRKAVDTVLRPAKEERAAHLPLIPARPVVLGGDDVTFIVRADLSFEFARVFLEEFEAESKKRLASDLPDVTGLPTHLSACAGISIVKSAYPFVQAYELSESLCRFAKNALPRSEGAPPAGSAMAFHRVTTSIAPDYPAIVEEELTADDGSLSLSFGPYGVGTHVEELPAYSHLAFLAKQLQEKAMPRGTIREMLAAAYEGKSTLAAMYRRYLELEKSRGVRSHDKGSGGRHPLTAALRRLVGDASASDLWRTDSGGPDRTPLGDAYVLGLVGGDSVQEGSK